jgi:hypothetical protein
VPAAFSRLHWTAGINLPKFGKKVRAKSHKWEDSRRGHNIFQDLSGSSSGPPFASNDIYLLKGKDMPHAHAKLERIKWLLPLILLINVTVLGLLRVYSYLNVKPFIAPPGSIPVSNLPPDNLLFNFSSSGSSEFGLPLAYFRVAAPGATEAPRPRRFPSA